MKIQLDDNGLHLELAPLTLMKPVGKLFFGAMTIEERWLMHFSGATFSFLTEEYLRVKYPKAENIDLKLAANVLPNEELVSAIEKLKNASLYIGDTWVATKGIEQDKIEYIGMPPIIIYKRWDIYSKNEELIRQDFQLLTHGQKSFDLSDSVTVIGDRNLVFVEKGVRAEACVLNVMEGPIYLSKNAEIMEGSLIRGPFVLGENATLKMGAKIYGGTSIGMYCKVGGEVGNSVFQAYSNKGHDGYMGNSLIGEWCNLGADTNTSNLKNNYGKIRTYNYALGSEEQTSLQFMGLSMGDHSKCGINTMFNTATVIGVSCNVFGAEFPSKHIPDFTWGAFNWSKFDLTKAIEAANNMMGRRHLQLSDADLTIFRYIFDKK
jgi:UDP-N-acetylglucosamine diphosphorylase/glucosamine-1-phosphate N-acetyltransferase